MSGPTTAFQTGTHASRPAASAGCVLYWCTTHNIFYRADGSAWATLQDLSGFGAALGAWTDFTPTVTGSVTNPTLGSSTLTGRYKLLDAKTCLFHINFNITTGGAWNPGSGNWIFALPVTTAAYRQTVVGHVNDAGTTRYIANGIIAAGGSTIAQSLAYTDTGGTNAIGATTPITWATGDYITFSGVVEVA